MRVRLLVSAALAALVVAVYLPVRSHDFVDFDDALYLAKARLGLGAEGLASAFGEQVAANWVPVTVLSMQAGHELHGRSAPGYLLGNVAIHAAASVALFAALAEATGAVAPAAFVAAVFGVHPLHVESVAWVSQRKDVLCGLFWMLALGAHVRFARRPSKRRQALVALWATLALLSKPMAVTLPFTLLLLDYWPLGRLAAAGRALPEPRRLAGAVVEKLPLFALAAAVAAITYAVQQASAAVAPAEALPLGTRVANALESCVAYARDAVWPTGLAAFYPHPLAPHPARAAAAAAGLAAATAACAAAARRQPFWITGWLWYLGTLVPVLGLVQVGQQARADRYTYVPLVGLTLALAFGARSLAQRAPRLRAPLALAGLVAVAALAVAARQQVGTWRDSHALYARALAVTRDNGFAHRGLARALADEGHTAEAVREFGEAIRLQPGWARPRLELAQLLLAHGDTDAAIAHYRLGLEREPGHLRARVQLGQALVAAGRPAEAPAELERVRAQLRAGASLSAPYRAALEEALGSVALRQARDRDAATHFRAALALDPSRVLAANDLAWLLATHPDPALRDADEAVRVAEALARRAARDPRVIDTLAAAYAAQGRYAEAAEQAERAGALAEAAGAVGLAAAIRDRAALYRQGEPYRAVAGGVAGRAASPAPAP